MEEHSTEEQHWLQELYEKLDEAERQKDEGVKCLSHKEVMERLRERLRSKSGKG